MQRILRSANSASSASTLKAADCWKGNPPPEESPFCLERGIRYHETGIFQSLKEIFHHLQEIGASVRVDDPAKISNS